MRMRKKKNGAARMEACADWLLKTPEDLTALQEHAPFYLEIGCGKGGFITATAKANPDRFYIAVELVSDALVTALERAKAEEIPNLRFVNLNAKNLCEWFAEGEIAEIYLNFSDPWPKKGHAKRRLTYRDFLAVYKSLLADGGKICMKTDNVGLFDFSLEEFTEAGWRLEAVTRDLHHSEWAEGNIMTEYEKNFSEQGYPIHRLEAYPA
ncbi:MAG: tRNA (guanosine(46)-N7)-methyltransferase TrmB [Eubacteriales bacterium]